MPEEITKEIISVAQLTEYTEEINRLIDKVERYVNGDIMQLPVNGACKILHAVRSFNDTIGYLKKRINAVHSRMKEHVVPTKFEEQGVTTITVDGYRYSVSHTTRAGIVDKLNAHEWLRANELGDIITETVNAQTLGAVARGLLEEGNELPEEFFKTYIQPNTSITKV